MPSEVWTVPATLLLSGSDIRMQSAISESPRSCFYCSVTQFDSLIECEPHGKKMNDPNPMMRMMFR